MSIKILSEPQSNGSRGPIPAKINWLDHRWRSLVGSSSDTIPFQKPGWVLERHWEAFRKAVERKSSYTKTKTIVVKGNLASLREYIRHLESCQLEEEIATVVATKKVFATPEIEEPEDPVILRGLSDQKLKQHAWYRAKGWQPWIWTEQRGANIVVLRKYWRQFLSWDRQQKALEAKPKEES